MTAKLEKLEAQIQEMIEIRMVSILPGQKIESAVVQQLAGAMHANINEVDGEKIAPSLYTLVTPPNESNLWQDARLLEALRESLYAVGCEAGLEFATPPTLSVSTDPKLAPGQVRVIASHKIESLGPTINMPQREPAEVDEEHIPDNAFIIINGRKVFPLKDRVINIGRRLENQLVIDDPRVSRTHAQLRAIKGRYVLFDLNSTGGTFINGQRTSQTALYPGDVISLAGVTLVFGQDNPPQRLDLKDTGPMNPQIIDRPTAILKERASIRKRKK
jgi:hypothetical protein